MLANTVPVILQDETFVRELVQQDRTIAERIVEFLLDFLNTLKTIYEQFIAESSWTQMELLRQDMETVGLIADLLMRRWRMQREIPQQQEKEVR